jgi:hypothetical protein
MSKDPVASILITFLRNVGKIYNTTQRNVLEDSKLILIFTAVRTLNLLSSTQVLSRHEAANQTWPLHVRLTPSYRQNIISFSSCLQGGVITQTFKTEI